MDNYTYGSYKYLPVGTVVQIISIGDIKYKRFVGEYATIVQEGKMMKDNFGDSCFAYPCNKFIGDIRQCFTRGTFNIMQYPAHTEQWLKTKMDFLTQPLEKFDDCVKNFIGDNPYNPVK